MGKNKKIKRKTNKSVKKRFRVTKNKKVLFTKSKRRHMMTDRSPKKKRQSRGWKAIDPTHRHAILKMLPYEN